MRFLQLFESGAPFIRCVRFINNLGIFRRQVSAIEPGQPDDEPLLLELRDAVVHKVKRGAVSLPVDAVDSSAIFERAEGPPPTAEQR